MTYTVAFQDPAAIRIEQSGGKGANLSILSQRHFPVPPGFVITAQAYHDFMAAEPDLMPKVAALPFEDAAKLREASEGLMRSLARLNLPDALVREVRERLGGFPSGQAFSVRSSSTMEDLASAAFAGQHETYLNCVGSESILQRIKDCYLSLWADRAIAYRRQQQFDHRLAAMAVVVQQMISCDVAGVAFSINPISGDLNEMVINANFGLGESVVSGEGEVDHFTIDKKSGAVREARIAEKTSRVVCSREGTTERTVSAEEAVRPSLDAAQLHELADLLQRVERSYGFPQDIEWGFAGGVLHLLQSRPITTIPPRWTREESAERFPNVLTPLTWDFVEEGFHRSLAHSFRLMGFPPFNGKWFGMHGHYIYGNQNVVELYARRAPFAPAGLDELRSAVPRLREHFSWVLELPLSWQRDLDYYLLRIGEFMAEPLGTKTTAEVWNFVLGVNVHGAQYFLPNIAISITHGSLFRFLHHILCLAVGPAEASGWFDRLMAHCETKTGVINKELFELAKLLRAQPALEAAISGRGSRQALEAGVLQEFPEFLERFQRFLRDHGHREIDFDAYAATWLEVPWVVLDNVRLMLKGPLDTPPAEKERALRMGQQQAELELYRRLPEDLHFFYGEILRLTRVYTSLDDLEHYQTTRLTLPLRRGLRELGARLVALGVIAEPMDVFFAHAAQIDAAIGADTSAGWRRLAGEVREQQAAYLADKARTPEWILDAPASALASPDEPGILKGLAGSAGVAEGPVYLVLGSDDFANFPKGAVLVARTTNPSWTPLFYNAVAVIAESGGPLSHGAVTAREMRIPAVMAVRNVLTLLRNGQRVRVDGVQGRVHLI